MKYGIPVLLFLILLISSVCTADTLKFVFSDFPPFEYSENGRIKGINVEIIEEACRRLDIKPIFIELPWKRALEQAKSGEADAVFSLFKNQERMAYYDFPDENLNSVTMTLLTHHQNDVEINGFEDFAGKRVGVFLGSSYGEKFDANKTIIRESAPTNEFLLKMQSAQRVDVTIMDERVARFWCKKMGMENQFRFIHFIVTQNHTYIAFTRAEGETDWAGLFSRVLKQMKDDGFIRGVNKRYEF